MATSESLARLRELRQRTLDRDGSPNYRHTFGTIAASGGAEVVEMQTDFPRSRRYEPLTSLLITNNSAADLDLEVNGVAHSFIPAGVIWPIVDTAIWSFRLTNNDAVEAAAGAVRANVSTPPMGADKAARRGL